jgi:uncharacterized iron-regulated protein
MTARAVSSSTGIDTALPRRGAAVFIRALPVLLLLAAGCTATVPHGHGVLSHPEQHTSGGSGPGPVQSTPVLDLGTLQDLESMIPKLVDKRVVFVSETHDRFDHHLTQLEIIRRLHALQPRLAIGMEAFQQPFQAVLDDYIAGKLSEQELLRDTEYYSRWRFDYRLYAPILRYAREQQLPVVALNLPAGLTRKVGREGLDALAADEREQLPAEIDRSDSGYEKRLREIFEQHPDNGRRFEDFLTVQLLWDEGMAERAADYLAHHPDESMVVLAGSGHIAWGSGIPRRLERRLHVDSAIVLNGWQGVLQPGLADFVLLTQERTLPPAGKLGVLLETEGDALVVMHCMPDSPCEQAGLRRGDRFVTIDDKPVTSMADLRLVTWDKLPGESVTLQVSRKRWFFPAQVRDYVIELQ